MTNKEQKKFTQLLPELREIAKNLCKFYRNQFVIDELINEAWIRSDFKEEKADIALILRSAKLDMIDYIRCCVGRDFYFIKGERIKNNKRRQLYLTNIDWENNIHSNFLLEQEYQDRALRNLEDKEIALRFLNSIESEKQKEATILFFFGEYTYKEVGEMLKKHESSVFKLVKLGLEQCKNSELFQECVSHGSE